jgi:hypothetical protein
MGIVKTLFRMDGWQNLLSGFGSKKDKGTVPENSVAGFNRITPVQLGVLYRTNAEIRNAIDMPAEDMTRCGFEVEGDDGTLYKAFQGIHGPAVFKQALQHTRLYGGAIVVLDIEGAGSWDTPWNPKNGGKIRRLVEYPRTRVNLAAMEVSKVPGSQYFDDFEMWSIFGASGTPFSVHASRILVFKSGSRVDILEPGYTDYERYWGLSEVYRGLDDAYGFGTTKQGTSHLMKECSVAKYRLSNLENLVAENDWQSLDNRLEAIDMQKSVVNGVFLGEGEEYTRENVTFSGVPEIWDRQMMAVSGAYRVPVTKMFGRSAAGMNATGEGDDDNYNAYIAGLQVTQELPPLLRLMECLNALLKIVKPDTKEMDARLSINFNPLSTRDQLKDAQVREAMSRADRNYVEAGILYPEDIIRNRFQGGYKVDTTVEELHTPDLTMEGAK